MKCLLLGYYGAKNLGDDMMLKALLNWLSSQNREVTVISENPDDTGNRFQVDNIQNTALFLQWGWIGTVLKGRGFRLLKAIYNNDELLIGGGDLIRDTNGWRNFFYTLEKPIVALLLGKTVYMASVGIGEPTKKYSKAILKFILPRFKLIIVRDKKSFDLCKKFGVKNVVLAPDIATQLIKKSIVKQKTTLHTDKNYCLVSLRSAPNVYGGYNMTDTHYQSLANILDTYISKTGHHVVFIPFQDFDNDGDNAQHTKVYNYMKNKSCTEILQWDGNLNNTFQLIANASILLGMRLHALIAAVTVNTPCIALPYDRKLHAFCDLSGATDTIEADELLENKNLAHILIQRSNQENHYHYLDLKEWDELSLNSQGQ